MQIAALLQRSYDGVPRKFTIYDQTKWARRQFDYYQPETDVMPAMACCFHPKMQSIAAFGWENGLVSVLSSRDIVTSEQSVSSESFLVKQRENQVLENAIFDIKWSSQKEEMLVAGASGIRLVDSNLLVPTSCFDDGLSGSVKSISIKTDNPNIFCAVSRGGQIAIGDTRGGMKVYHGAHKCRTPFKMRRRRSLIESNPAITCVSFLAHNPNIVCTSTDARAELLFQDIRFLNGEHLSKAGPPEGIPRCGISWFSTDNRGERSYAVTKKGVMCFDTLHPENGMIDFYCSRSYEMRSFYLRCAINPENSLLACTSSNGRILIWDLINRNRPAALLRHMHDDEVGCVAWNSAGNKIACGSDGGSARVWDKDLACYFPEADDISYAHIDIDGRVPANKNPFYINERKKSQGRDYKDSISGDLHKLSKSSKKTKWGDIRLFLEGSSDNPKNDENINLENNRKRRHTSIL